MWELERKLLQAHALPLVAGYCAEVATAMRALDMDDSLPPEILQGGCDGWWWGGGGWVGEGGWVGKRSAGWVGACLRA